MNINRRLIDNEWFQIELNLEWVRSLINRFSSKRPLYNEDRFQIIYYYVWSVGSLFWVWFNRNAITRCVSWQYFWQVNFATIYSAIPVNLIMKVDRARRWSFFFVIHAATFNLWPPPTWLTRQKKVPRCFHVVLKSHFVSSLFSFWICATTYNDVIRIHFILWLGLSSKHLKSIANISTVIK